MRVHAGEAVLDGGANVGVFTLKGLNPDFRFERIGTNLPILSDLFIRGGPDTREASRRIWDSNSPL